MFGQLDIWCVEQNSLSPLSSHVHGIISQTYEYGDHMAKGKKARDWTELAHQQAF